MLFLLRPEAADGRRPDYRAAGFVCAEPSGERKPAAGGGRKPTAALGLATGAGLWQELRDFGRRLAVER